MTPARPVPHQTRPAQDWTDTAIEWASGATAVAMFAYGVSLSYSALHRIAWPPGCRPGQPGCGRWASRRSWPLPR
jgi:hypothetical protein